MSNLSSANDDDDGGDDDGDGGNEGGKRRRSFSSSSSSPMASVKSAFGGVSDAVGRGTSQISSGFASAAERGGSDIRSLADGTRTGVEKFARRGTRDVRRTTLGAQRAAKQTTDGISNMGQSMGRSMGQGLSLSDMQFFRVASSETSRREQRDGRASLGAAGSGDYLSNLSASNNEPASKERPSSPIANVRSAFESVSRSMERRTSELADARFLPEVNFSSPKIVTAEEVARWMDSQARSGTEIARSGTEMVGSGARTLVLNFTGKREYRFGDVTKELMHRVASSEINMQDTILLLKILLALGATLGPLTQLLPFTFLVEVLNLSLEQKVGGKILEVLSKTLDSRLVASLFTGDDKNLIGDVVKRSVLGGVLQFTGKSDYEPGDIQRTVQQRGQQDGEDGSEVMRLELEDVAAEFEEWDRQFVERLETEEYMGNRAREMDMKIAMALEECEAISREK